MNEILEEIYAKIDKPLCDARFGDNWKEYAMEHIDKEQLVHTAWIQGRKAILLEEKLKQILECI